MSQHEKIVALILQRALSFALQSRQGCIPSIEINVRNVLVKA